MRTSVTCLAIAIALGLTAGAAAQDHAPGSDPAWTGVSNVEDLIAARQALMLAIEELMEPIDTYTVDAGQDPDEVRSAAETVAAMLLAVPHLFPPTTNLYDPEAQYPETIALPRIWDEFATFYGMAAAASPAATAVTEARDGEPLRTASLALRASCDACHALYLRPYEPSEVTQEDLDFDFDSVFQNK